MKREKEWGNSVTGAVSATVVTALILLLSFGFAVPAAQAEMVANTLALYLDKDTADKKIQLEGSANYPTFKYEVTRGPMNGTLILDSASGKATYTPNSGFAGVDSFKYRIVSTINSTWTSSNAVVKMAVGEPWHEFCGSDLNPLQLSLYMKDKSLGVPSNSPEIIGTTNIEPIKATPYGHMAYTNAKIAVEMSGQSWWALNLGQKAFLIDQYCNLLDKAELQGYGD